MRIEEISHQSSVRKSLANFKFNLILTRKMLPVLQITALGLIVESFLLTTYKNCDFIILYVYTV